MGTAEVSETPLDSLPSSVFTRVEVGRLCRDSWTTWETSCQVPYLLFRGRGTGPVPQEGGGLGRARTAGSEGASSTKALMKRRCAWRRQWPLKSDFASFWLNYVLAILSDTAKSVTFTLTSINHLYRSKFIAAYSMLHMRHQSFNPFCPNYFNICNQIRCSIFHFMEHCAKMG